jgi:hypothetical protein
LKPPNVAPSARYQDEGLLGGRQQQEDHLFRPLPADRQPGVHRCNREGRRFGAIVESLLSGGQTANIVVERAMYWNPKGIHWAAGTDALASRLR